MINQVGCPFRFIEKWNFSPIKSQTIFELNLITALFPYQVYSNLFNILHLKVQNQILTPP